LLAALGANIKARDKWGFTPLHAAAAQGSQSLVELLMAKGADVNAKNNSGYTLAQLAIAQGHRTIAKLLIAPVGR